MNIRTAILKAADHIEANPGEFMFSSVRLPSAPGCGTPGCAIGWIASFVGEKDRIRAFGLYCTDDKMLGISHGDFYRRMDKLEDSGRWRYSANLCARALRLYADKYHPVEEFPSIRAELDRIFEAVTCN